MTVTLPPGADRIELMQTFIRIVETGSLSAAAQQLGTSQPTVSRRLQALERSLGVKLLQRSTHVMKLTEDGDRCFAHAKALLEDWRAMEDDLRGTADTPRGTLRVLDKASAEYECIHRCAKVSGLEANPVVAGQFRLRERRQQAHRTRSGGMQECES